MIDLDLRFPVFDDGQMPPPVLSLSQYVQRVAACWHGYSPREREERLRRDERERAPIRFRIHTSGESAAAT